MGQAPANLVIVASIGKALPLVSTPFGVAPGSERIDLQLGTASALAVTGGVAATSAFPARMALRGSEFAALVSVVLWTS